MRRGSKDLRTLLKKKASGITRKEEEEEEKDNKSTTRLSRLSIDTSASSDDGTYKDDILRTPELDALESPIVSSESPKPPLLALVKRRGSVVLRSLSTPTNEKMPTSPHLMTSKSRFSRSATDILRHAVAGVQVSLDLSNQLLGDENVRALCKTMEAGKSKLIFLDLKGNHIGRVGSRSLAKMLVRNKKLVVLGLSKNDIKDVGVELLSRALSVNSTLKVLKLGKNSITDHGAESIANVLCMCQTLESLHLNHNMITDIGAQRILRSLFFNSSLKVLFLNGNLGITDKIVDESKRTIPFNASIYLIRFDGCSIGASARKELKEIETTSSANGGRVHMVTEMGRGTVTVEHGRRPLPMEALTDKGSAHSLLVRDFTSFKFLSFRGFGFGDENALVLAKGLSKMQQLIRLDLSWCALSDVGVCALTEGMGTDAAQSLRHLDVSYNNFGSGGVRAIVDLLVRSKSLDALYLKGNALTDDEVKILLDCYMPDPASDRSMPATIKVLKLGRNRITDVGACEIARHIASPLSSFSRILALDLGHNPVRRTGAESIAEALQSSKSEIELTLAGCPFGDAGAVALAKMLGENKHVKFLNVSDCGITDSGCRALVEGIRTNAKIGGELKGLMFECNVNISDDMEEQMANAMHAHKNMLVDHTRMPDAARRKLERLRVQDMKERQREKASKNVKKNLDNPNARDMLVNLQKDMRSLVASEVMRKNYKCYGGTTPPGMAGRCTKGLEGLQSKIQQVIESEMKRIKGLTKSRTDCFYKHLGVRWELLKDIKMDNAKTFPHIQPISISTLNMQRSSSQRHLMPARRGSVSTESAPRRGSIDGAQPTDALMSRVYAQSLAPYFRKCCENLLARVNDCKDVTDLCDLSKFGFPCLEFDNKLHVHGKRGDVMFGPIKGIDRVLVKAEEKQEEIDNGKLPRFCKDGKGRPRRLRGIDYVLDWLRATVYSQDPYVLSVFFLLLQESNEMFEVQRVKNKFFDMKYPENIRTNVLINLLLKYPATLDSYRVSGLMLGDFDPELAGKALTSCEIQLTLMDFLMIKSLMHTYYEVKRSSEGAASVLERPIFMNADTMKSALPAVVKEIREQDWCSKKIAIKWLTKVRARARSRRASAASAASLPSPTEKDDSATKDGDAAARRSTEKEGGEILTESAPKIDL